MVTMSSDYILVVEDSPDLRDLIFELYRIEGYPVQTAQNGQDALDFLSKAEKLPCVILLDLMMPGMDGFKFREIQKQDPRLAKIPVLIMTADAHAKDKAKKAEANGFLKKPVEAETLIKVAEKFCPKPPAAFS